MALKEPLEEFDSYFKGLENLEKIRRANDLATLPVDNKKLFTNSLGKYSNV
jgi:hypothetical protein